MAPRKQKAPEKKPRSLMARLLSSTAIGLGLGGRGLGRLAMRYPRPALGAAVFLGIFGTIAANALWYQPHRINQPFLATRTFGAFDSLPGLKTASLPAGEVTTYRIERQDDVVIEGETPARPAPAAAAAGAPALAAPATSGETENVALAVAVQQALIRRGLYNGAADGVIGPRTSAAILFFEQTEGLAETGAVSQSLLNALMADGGGETRPATLASATPAAATPAPAAAAPAASIDPVAAAILNAEVPVPAAKPHRQKKAAEAATPIASAGPAEAPVVKAAAKGDDLAALIRANGGPAEPAPAPKAAAEAAAIPADPALVSQIQSGLARMGYPNTDPPGTPCPGTRNAISQFQKYYRLPVTGQPSAALLAKLKEIGAV